jgi:DNA-binding NtrC family response regulator
MNSTLSTPAMILIVEDNAAECAALSRLLRLEGYKVLTASDVSQALEAAAQPIDLVISDLCLGRESGLDILRHWRRYAPRTPFLLTTAFGTVDTAVTAMKLGAADFLPKPVNPDDLLIMVASLLRRQRLPLTKLPAVGVEKLLGRAPAIQQVREQCEKVAPSDCPVLIIGESGTGKELAAEAIHALSPRSAAPRITVNMTSIPETLIESELLGHAKGTTTDLQVKHLGRIQAAHQGTLFIDEVGDLPLAVQTNLLRVMETQRVIPLGSDEEFPADARIIAATSKDLLKMVKEGTFREDLYFRLNVVQLQMPPLRERREDIPELAEFYLREYARNSQAEPRKLQIELLNFLCSYNWPGNIRQLRNCLESMCTLSDEAELGLSDLPPDLRNVAGVANWQPSRHLDALKKQAILQALESHGGNRTRTAEFLGISVRTLQRKIQEWGLASETPSS